MANSQFDDTGRAGTLLFYGAMAFILLVMLINYIYSLNMVVFIGLWRFHRGFFGFWSKIGVFMYVY